MLIKQAANPLNAALAHIPLGKGLYAIVDPEDLPWLIHYHWFARKSKCRWYAQRKFVRNGKEHVIRMHRQIMDCPPDMQVHHHNGNTLDNRKGNLSNIEPALHAALRISR
jgi:hypothetical protein